MPIAEPGGVARGCSQRSGTGGAAAEGGVRAARGSVRAGRESVRAGRGGQACSSRRCSRRPEEPVAAAEGGRRSGGGGGRRGGGGANRAGRGTIRAGRRGRRSRGGRQWRRGRRSGGGASRGGRRCSQLPGPVHAVLQRPHRPGCPRRRAGLWQPGVAAEGGAVAAAEGSCACGAGRSRRRRGGGLRRPGAVQDGPGCSRRPGRPILAVRAPVRAARQGFCPRRPAGVLSAATGEGLRRRAGSQRAPPIRAARKPVRAVLQRPHRPGVRGGRDQSQRPGESVRAARGCPRRPGSLP